MRGAGDSEADEDSSWKLEDFLTLEEDEGLDRIDVDDIIAQSLAKAGLPFPQSLDIETDEAFEAREKESFEGGYIKSGDVLGADIINKCAETYTCDKVLGCEEISSSYPTDVGTLDISCSRIAKTNIDIKDNFNTNDRYELGNVDMKEVRNV